MSGKLRVGKRRSGTGVVVGEEWKWCSGRRREGYLLTRDDNVFPIGASRRHGTD